MQKQELFIPGPAGDIEAVLHLPDQSNSEYFGIVCHPHPLQEGTMNNKVVTTVVKAYNSLNIPCVRFNFRGVGKSAGSYGNVFGEVEDSVAVAQWIQQQYPQVQFCISGFSFGSYVAAALATQVPTKNLITIAPPVERMPYTELAPITCPWLVIQGETDDVVTPAAVYAWYDQLVANKTLKKFPDTGHFFHGKLVELQDTIEQFILKNLVD